MKTKLYKLFGVTLALVLVFSLAGAFMPVNRAEAVDPGTTANMWAPISLPGAGGSKLRNSDVADIAVANDSNTVYVVDPISPQVGRSTNKGGAFTGLTLPTLAAGFVAPARLVAVAPDDPNSIAIVDSSTPAGFAMGTVWISNNQGATWAALSGVPGGITDTVTDIAIGPSRTGTILNRDYVVSVAETAAGAAGGDVFVLGLTTTWTSIATALGILNTYDFMAVAVSPGYLGDRVVVAIGAGAAATDAGTGAVGVAGDTFLFMVRLSDVAPLATLVNPPGAVRLDTSTSDSPSDYDTVTPAGITHASIALPTDFDPTTVGGRRVFLSWTSTGVLNADDAYRVDNANVRKLQTGSAMGIWSVAYSGTMASGTLIAGNAAVTAGNLNTDVYFSTDPQLAQPTWTASSKAPTGGTGMAVVGIDPADPTIVYAGTTGVESAFSKSLDGGASFNQTAYINTAIAAIHDVALTPDGDTIFMATADTAAVAGTSSGSNRESLWMSATPTGGTSWQRINMSPADWGNVTGDSFVLLNPEWDSSPALYWIDRGSGALVGTQGIQRSVDGGGVFSTRVSPTATLADATMENADILYVIDGATNNMWKSTNGAWFFGLPVGIGGGGNGFDIEMAPSYPALPVAGNLVYGSTTNTVKASTNGGDSWSTLGTAIAGQTFASVVADADWAANSTVYTASNTNGGGIWRFIRGTSSVWEQIFTAGAYVGPGGAVGAQNMTSLATAEGVLYGSWNTGAVAPGAAPSGVARTLNPTLALIAALTFDQMDVGSAAANFSWPAAASPTSDIMKIATDGSTVSLWTIDSTAQTVMAYWDTMAFAQLTANVPDLVQFDSVTGGNRQFVISWDQLSNATNYQIQIATDPAITQVIVNLGAAAPWYTPANPLQPTLLIGTNTLQAGVDYFMRIRIRDQVPLDAIRSPWSSVHRFTVEGGERVEVPFVGPQPTSPPSGSINVPQSPGFGWTPYAGSTRYEFQLSKDPSFTDLLVSEKVSVTGYSYTGTLDREVTYFWRVRGIEPSITPWGPTSTFTVASAPVEPTPPVVINPPPPAPEPVITPVIIWTIIGIGVVLVIAVIVLIVRTRRTV